jgi:hypothetical protein
MGRVLLILILLPTTAHADSDSLLTVGLGTAIGMTKLDALPAQEVGGELKARARVLLGLGAELSYTPTPAGETSQLVYDNRIRFSGLLYIVPTTPLGAYLKAGIGGEQLGGLFSLTAPTACYHGGAGLDLQLDEHLVLGGEVLWLVPGVASLAAGHAVNGETLAKANYRAALSIMYYL